MSEDEYRSFYKAISNDWDDFAIKRQPKFWLAPSPAKVGSECIPALSATRQLPSFSKWPGFAQCHDGYDPECAVHGSAGLVAWLENTQASTTSSSFFPQRHTNDNLHFDGKNTCDNAHETDKVLNFLLPSSFHSFREQDMRLSIDVSKIYM